ncbi:MAG: DNA polymerase III subunit gamma/tau, partial [Acidimicrobiales bacterium]
MAHQSLYRRYRPQRFGEIVGQPHVVAALRNAVRDGRTGHAYLFSGPRGTGKTSTARILAKALNCTDLHDGEPCGVCEACKAVEAGVSFDLQELDAASNNGVEAMRDLIARAALGSPGRSKVYILDEVHMLSAAASNALLKTLEEPPEHVTFVLATTDPQKVLPTIRSRTQHLEFTLLGAEELERHVRWVAQDAGLSIDEEALAWVLRKGGGSARDTLSALDQVAAAGGAAGGEEPVDALVAALVERSPGAALAAVAGGVAAGREPRTMAEALIARLRDAFLCSMGAAPAQLTAEARARSAEEARALGAPALTRGLEELGEALVEMRQAPDPRIPLEVALVRLTRADLDRSVGALIERIERLERQLAGTPPAAAPAAPAAPADPGARAGRDAETEAETETVAGPGDAAAAPEPAPSP